MVLSRPRPQTVTAPVMEVGYLGLSTHINYSRVRPCYLNPGTCTALGQAEEFATYFLKVLKLVVAFPVGLMTLFILYNSLMRTANSFIVINSPNS